MTTQPQNAARVHEKIDVSDCRSSADVLAKTGFGFKVGLVPAKYLNPLTKKVEDTPASRVVVRLDTGDSLAVVGERYVPVQADDFMSRLDPVIKERKLKYKSAAVFDKGRVMVVEAELPEPIRLPAPNGKEDVLLRRVLWRNSHDGTQQVNLQDFLLRQWCSNGATHILGMSSTSVRHTSSAEGKLEQASHAIAKAIQRFTGVEKQVRRLAATPFTDAMMERVTEKLYPGGDKEDPSSRTLNARASLVELFRNGQGTFGRSAWDAVNALTEWSTHHRPVRQGPSADLSRVRTMWTVGDIRVREGYEAVLEAAGHHRAA